MNTDPCPISDMLAQLYPNDSPNNPWINGDGTGCQNITPGASVAPHAQTVPGGVSSTGSGSSTPAAMADQNVVSGAADPTHPFTATLDPEGADRMNATVYIPSGVTPTITVTTPTGATDPNATVTLRPDTDGLGAQTAQIALTQLGGDGLIH